MLQKSHFVVKAPWTGFLGQLMPLLQVPSCRHLALRALSTITHHGGAEIRAEIAKWYLDLLRLLKEYLDDRKTVELSVVVLSHSLAATITAEGIKLDSLLGEYLALYEVLESVTDILRKPAPSRVLVDHGVQLLAMSTMHSKVPPSTVKLLIAGLRSKDWIFRCTCLGGLLRLHRKAAEPDQRYFDPMKLIESKPTPPHLSEILCAYGPQQCETYLTLQTASDLQRAMVNVVSTRDLYALGVNLAGFILR
jgi:hypothetical protein